MSAKGVKAARGHISNKEEELALKQEQQRAFLQREVKYGKETMVHHQNRWRWLLLEVAVPKLRAEVECAWHIFEYAIDSKDFLISVLLDELDRAKKQAELSLHSHMDKINNIIISYHDQIMDVRRLSTKIIYDLYKAGTFERQNFLCLANEHTLYLKTMMRYLEETRKENYRSINCEYSSKIHSENTRLAEEKAKQLMEYNFKIQEVTNDAQEFIKAHIHDYSSRKNIFLVLSMADNNMQRKISSNWDKIQMRLYKIGILKGRYEALQKAKAAKIEEMSFHHAHYQSLLSIFRKCRDTQYKQDSENLKTLVIVSNGIIDFLKKVVADGERLLTLAAICRKYETLEEKVMTFPKYSDSFSRKTAAKLDRTYRECNYFPELKSFWHRFAAIEASRYKLLKECQIRRRINEQLQRDTCNV